MHKIAPYAIFVLATTLFALFCKTTFAIFAVVCIWLFIHLLLTNGPRDVTK